MSREQVNNLYFKIQILEYLTRQYLKKKQGKTILQKIHFIIIKKPSDKYIYIM